jgi:hypothetical protein
MGPAIAVPVAAVALTHSVRAVVPGEEAGETDHGVRRPRTLVASKRQSRLDPRRLAGVRL